MKHKILLSILTTHKVNARKCYNLDGLFPPRSLADFRQPVDQTCLFGAWWCSSAAKCRQLPSRSAIIQRSPNIRSWEFQPMGEVLLCVTDIFYTLNKLFRVERGVREYCFYSPYQNLKKWCVGAKKVLESTAGDDRLSWLYLRMSSVTELYIISM